MANSSTRIHPRVNPNARRIFHASAVIDAPLQLFLRTRGSDRRWLWLAARTSLRIFVCDRHFNALRIDPVFKHSKIRAKAFNGKQEIPATVQSLNLIF
jgi:hypothetical protein